MKAEEFTRICSEGALGHPLPMFRLTRALLCLFSIIETVPGAEAAFRDWCADREAQDRVPEDEVC